MQGNSSLEGLEAAGNDLPEGLPHFNNNFMVPGSASSHSPSQSHAGGLQLERWRRQPLGLALGLDLGTYQRGRRRRLPSVGEKHTEC